MVCRLVEFSLNSKSISAQFAQLVKFAKLTKLIQLALFDKKIQVIEMLLLAVIFCGVVK